MEDGKKCCHNMMEVIKTHKGPFFGAVLIVLATLFTWASLDGLGILGMFLVGICLLKHCSWKHHGCCSGCPCCKDTGTCHTSEECCDEKGECSDKKSKK